MYRLVLAFLSTTFAAIALAAVSPVVATIGSKNITLEEFNRRFDLVKKEAVNPPEKKLFLEDLVRYEMGIQEAEKRKLENDPLIAERMREELYKGLIEKDLSAKINEIKVAKGELEDYYKTSPELRSSHILIEVKPGATAQERAAARKRAEEIYNEVRKSKRSFEDLVKLYTDDIATKSHGGDVGYQTRLSVVPAYYEATLKLDIGDISSIVETPYGFHIIKLTGKHTFKEANERQMRAAVFERKRLTIFNDYFDKMKKRYKIVINSEALTL